MAGRMLSLRVDSPQWPSSGWAFSSKKGCSLTFWTLRSDIWAFTKSEAFMIFGSEVCTRLECSKWTLVIALATIDGCFLPFLHQGISWYSHRLQFRCCLILFTAMILMYQEFLLETSQGGHRKVAHRWIMLDGLPSVSTTEADYVYMLKHFSEFHLDYMADRPLVFFRAFWLISGPGTQGPR